MKGSGRTLRGRCRQHSGTDTLDRLGNVHYLKWVERSVSTVMVLSINAKRKSVSRVEHRDIYGTSMPKKCKARSEDPELAVRTDTYITCSLSPLLKSL